jgi:hypothetical protein
LTEGTINIAKEKDKMLRLDLTKEAGKGKKTKGKAIWAFGFFCPKI